VAIVIYWASFPMRIGFSIDTQEHPSYILIVKKHYWIRLSSNPSIGLFQKKGMLKNNSAMLKNQKLNFYTGEKSINQF